MALEPGLYESIVTEALAEELAQIRDKYAIEKDKPTSAEIADRVALHVGHVLIRAIRSKGDKERLEIASSLHRALIGMISEAIDDDSVLADRSVDSLSLLRGIFRYLPDGAPARQTPPMVPLLDTTLMSNSPGEPRIGKQILSEISSANQVDLIMAFIRRSGIRPFESALKSHCEEGGRVRVLTTTYTGSTEAQALERLKELGADVKVSYDQGSTRLHAKAWIFHRDSGFSTAYIGSSNLTHSAQVTGLEWNIRLSGVRNPDALRKMTSMFDSYWESGDFSAFDHEEFTKATTASSSSQLAMSLSPIEIRLEPFQEGLLEKVAVARSKGKHRNLLVAATGTGKTVMAAVDYARLSSQMGRSRLLFVAHRKEILDQARSTFRHALRDASFGELWVSGKRPIQFQHVFASAQSLSAAGLSNLEPDRFDVVIIDEFHHAAAKSYEALLGHLSPKELLGLTATPERSDNLPILKWFDDEIAAELMLWDAIDQQRLSPFTYFGISDGVDLTNIPWRRGHGYDTKALEGVYTSTEAWARLVIKAVQDHVDDLSKMCALGYCVSIEHAKFMAAQFQKANIPATFVTGETDGDEREDALSALRRGDLKIIFSVDLFNEGLDVPGVDTLLLLRPTDSPVLFTQQLGRGLRKHYDKPACLVLDFVGRHRAEFRFDRRFGALLRGSRKEIQRQVESGFPYLPAGCHMELDRVATEVVLDSLKSSIPSRWNEKVQELRRFSSSFGAPKLKDFLRETGLSLEDIYSGRTQSSGWSNLLEAAGYKVMKEGPFEQTLRSAIGRLLHIDDDRIEWYSDFMRDMESKGRWDIRGKRKIKMLLAGLFRSKAADYSLSEGVKVLRQHPQVVHELLELLDILSESRGYLQEPLKSRPNVPLMIHSRYTRDEIVSAFGAGDETMVRARPWREGVLWVERELANVLAVTLNKSEGFSPTTRYRDYAISRDLFHWESQSLTRASSPTGLRYQNHKKEGSAVMLFARETGGDRAFWFLGPAQYVSHQSEQPIQITWKLDVPIPGDLFGQFAAAIA